MKIDHLQLIQSGEYQEVLADRLAALAGAGGQSLMTVVHEFDDRCCHQEPWAETWDRVLRAANERRGIAALVVRPTFG